MGRSAYGSSIVILGVLVAWASRAAENGSVGGKVDAVPAKYLNETVVFVKNVAHAPAPKTVDMGLRKTKVTPHLLIIAVGDTVKFLNQDTVPLDVFSPEGEYNLGTLAPNEAKTHLFTTPGPFSQRSNASPDILAYIFVAKGPYASAVDENGRYLIKNVPPGTYTVGIWSSNLKAPDAPITVTAGKRAELNFSLRR